MCLRLSLRKYRGFGKKFCCVYWRIVGLSVFSVYSYSESIFLGIVCMSFACYVKISMLEFWFGII
jgi:hypothetical protein